MVNQEKLKMLTVSNSVLQKFTNGRSDRTTNGYFLSKKATDIQTETWGSLLSSQTTFPILIVFSLLHSSMKLPTKAFGWLVNRWPVTNWELLTFALTVCILYNTYIQVTVNGVIGYEVDETVRNTLDWKLSIVSTFVPAVVCRRSTRSLL